LARAAAVSSAVVPARAKGAAMRMRLLAPAAVSGGACALPAPLSQTFTVVPALAPAGAGTSPVRARPSAIQRAGDQTSQELAPLSANSGPGTGFTRTALTWCHDLSARWMAIFSAWAHRPAPVAASGPRTRNAVIAAGRGHP